MEKLTMESKSISQEHIQKIRELFPNCVTEVKDEKTGKVTLGVDFDVLKQDLSDSVIDDRQERYQMTWPGKKEAIAFSNLSEDKTLRPFVDKSLDFYNTSNIYIEGENLSALKILRETYLGKIKMIYLDPPYNTGKDFIYHDDFSRTKAEYIHQSGQYDDEGNRLVCNLESNGRFHSDWLTMLYSRLRLSRDLLKEDGAIFISIDDNEQFNLAKICEEIFGKANKVAEFVVIRSEGGGMAKQVIKGHDYLFVYAKNINAFKPLGKPKDVRGKIIEKDGKKYWIQEDWLRKEFGKYGNCHYEEILECKGQEKLDEINQGIKQGKYVLIPKKNGMNIVGKLRELSLDSSKFYSVLKHLSADGITDLEKFGMDNYFDYPKPVSLIQELIEGMTLFSANEEDIVLDFFSGSATTAEAVFRQNAKDGGNRKFILVQYPVENAENSQMVKEGYRTICDTGEERIRLAGKAIKEENPLISQHLDVGFRVFKIDSSNFKNVCHSPDSQTINYLFDDVSNIKDDRSSLDLLFQTMLQLGISLSETIKEKSLCSKEVYIVGDDELIVCFENEVSEELISAIAMMHPLYACFRELSFSKDSSRVNCDQIFKSISPITRVKVI